jgi:uncharacterized membrane protein YhaH (DUF805 family)
MMNSIARYRKYLADNPENYWFKRKTYGWGWVPAGLPGWLSLGVFIAILYLLVKNFLILTVPSGADVWHFMIKVWIWVAILSAFCYLTGEPPKWQWGLPKKNAKRH